ncbi:hypothetical protein [Paenibacillus montanisoli]|uniref:Uncharacterized protein n=1 Tax=Paenibacillus montanisoli TaxID=2081970 RepID=A0A328TUA7_9BACL|nr:hypothetical protein [Paenibacillus montanisoli]RAP74128.1 hypothetical protein DL346_23955 [Paenibacillus montanisoli]
MHAAKWLKWKIGAVCAALLVVVFQLVKSSPQFELQLDRVAAAKNTPEDTPAFQQGQDDSVMQEWQSSVSDDAPGGDRQQRRGSRHFSGRGDSGFSSSDGGSDTRTSRS